MEKNRQEFIQKYKLKSQPSYSYTSKRGNAHNYSRNIQNNPYLTKRILERLGKKGITISLATILAISSASAAILNHHNHSHISDPIERINITNKTNQQNQDLQNIKTTLENKTLSDIELKNLQDTIVEFSYNIGKEKISNSMEDVSVDRISFIFNVEPGTNNSWQAVVIQDDSDIAHMDSNGISVMDHVCSTLPDSKYKIDDNIANYIKNIEILKNLENPSQEELKNALDNIEQFSSYNIEFNNGNLESTSNIIDQKTDEISIDEER